MEEHSIHTATINSKKARAMASHVLEQSPVSSYEAIDQLMSWVMDFKDQDSSGNSWNDVANQLKVTPSNDIEKGEKLKALNLNYRRNRLYHKFIRIKKELDFINKNIKNFRAITPREKEIIRLLSNGFNNCEIAEQLFISRYTVEQHRKNINRKLKIKSFPQLILYSYAFDLV